ncbi:hypothetical protein FDP41_001198 [Naegleria fowleri]|uniref:DUF938 domain-containing protein n=1 Tax=Naegleria fowleri TaxID=5763 RepID=A0A6A5C3H9_NAEFO|nr:uncharacterized protein FDP41_001198 [Naegleria fowleri]KAF0980045.1 hypothetical protein FDP41_001198 [Naegleria fowleri]CAG4708484.1 unnamed protein product [Naegleria fowleri]
MSFSSNYSEAAERNKEPLRQVLSQFLSSMEKSLPSSLSSSSSLDENKKKRILEIASGYGQHVSHFARSFPNYEFQPSELTPQNFESIMERCKELSNVKPPILIDISKELEELMTLESGALQTTYHSIIAINLLHISPWKTTPMLIKNASRLLQHDDDDDDDGGYLFIYGPFNVNHEYTSEGNKNFDEHLKSRCEEWGIRDVQDVEKEAHLCGFILLERIPMPANNFTLVFKKKSTKHNDH